MKVMHCGILCLLELFAFQVTVVAQEVQEENIDIHPEISEEMEARLEDMTSIHEDVVTEDESFVQDLDFYSRHPINLNTTDRGTIEKLHLLSPAQIDHFIAYRIAMGDFLNIYEIQAIPGWDIPTIRNLLPFVTVSSYRRNIPVHERFQEGEHILLARYTRVLEKAEGFLRDGKDGRSFYPGNPDKYLLRYKFRSMNKLQYGITAEKDPGEQFFAGHQKQGFDFYSAHFYAQNLGIIRTIAIGDFAVNLGQGLVQWQSLSFASPGEAIMIKRQGDKLRPYASAGEVLFNRGVGITLSGSNWQGTAFVSIRNLDASTDKDTLDFATSIRLSGLHRTSSEVNGANRLNQLSYGGNIQYTGRNYKIGFNTVQYHFSKPLFRGDQLYRKFISPGAYAANYSIDYSFTYKGVHFFGESAVDKNADAAFVNGFAFSANRYVDLGLLHRYISERYLSLYGDAFTQSTSVVNENGMYLSLNLRPVETIRIDTYADLFKFPWLRYRVDAPSMGSEYMIQTDYRPSRQARFYLRYRSTNKAINTTITGHPMPVVENKVRQNLRAQMNLKMNSSFTFRTRMEQVWYDSQSGFMIYGDILYKPLLKKLSGNIRLQYFETDDYDARVYTFENDVLYSYSIPVFYGHGYRYYVNLRYNLLHDLSLWMRLAQTRYLDRNEIGSGLDKIVGNRRTELKTELVWRF